MKAGFLLVSALFGLVLPGRAQSTGSAADPAALSALRQRFQALLNEAEIAPRTRWLAALEALERQKVAEGDFAGAAEVRGRRLGQASPAANGAPARPPVVLNAASARTTNAVDFADGKKDVARFRRSGALMEWELPGQIPGSYQVNLVFSVMGSTDQNDQLDPYADPQVSLPARNPEELDESAAGGVVEFRKITNLKEGGALLRRSVRSTGGWAKSRMLNLGVVDLDSKIVKFSLRAVEALPAGAMDFHRLELVPVNREAAAATPVETGSPRELARLKEVYQKQFTDQTRSLHVRYLKNLGDLEVAATRSGDTELLAQVRQERKRLEGGNPAATTDSSAGNGHVLPVVEKLHMMVRGEAKLTNQGDYLTRLRPAKTGEVIWKLAGLGVPSGTYHVIVDCRMSALNGGTATIQAGSTGAAEPGPPLSFKVSGAEATSVLEPAKNAVVRTVQAGVVTIPKGSQYLTLRVDSLDNPQSWLFDLKSLTLTPVTP